MTQSASTKPYSEGVAARLPDGFKFVVTSTTDNTRLQLSGPIETQDELDAVVAALHVMRSWLRVSAATPRPDEPETDA